MVESLALALGTEAVEAALVISVAVAVLAVVMHKVLAVVVHLGLTHLVYKCQTFQE
jgi:hypothetical protein